MKNGSSLFHGLGGAVVHDPPDVGLVDAAQAPPQRVNGKGVDSRRERNGGGREGREEGKGGRTEERRAAKGVARRPAAGARLVQRLPRRLESRRRE